MSTLVFIADRSTMGTSDLVWLLVLIFAIAALAHLSVRWGERLKARDERAAQMPRQWDGGEEQ